MGDARERAPTASGSRERERDPTAARLSFGCDTGDAARIRGGDARTLLPVTVMLSTAVSLSWSDDMTTG